MQRLQLSHTVKLIHSESTVVTLTTLSRLKIYRYRGEYRHIRSHPIDRDEERILYHLLYNFQSGSIHFSQKGSVMRQVLVANTCHDYGVSCDSDDSDSDGDGDDPPLGEG
jgi:hypothetical protein